MPRFAALGANCTVLDYAEKQLENERKLSPREFLGALEKRELELIDVLAVHGAEGVIGQRSRQTLRRKRDLSRKAHTQPHGKMC